MLFPISTATPQSIHLEHFVSFPKIQLDDISSLVLFLVERYHHHLRQAFRMQDSHRIY